MKSDAERGRWGSWLRRERLAKEWSTEKVRQELAKGGYRVSESAYAEWESGYKKQPAKDAIPHLVALFGSEPASDTRPTPDDTATALRELVEEVRLSRLAQERTAGVLVDLMGLVLAGRLPQSETEAEAAAPAHRDRS